MTTNFFQKIAGLQLPGIWKLIIETDAQGNFTVSNLFNSPCGDNAAKLIVPLTLSGTAQDLDEGFFDKIIEPIGITATLQTNIETYLKSVEEAKAASKMEQDKRNKEKAQATVTSKKTDDDTELPEPKISREEMKKAYDDAMEQVSELIKKLKFSEALTILPAVKDYPSKANELNKKRQYLEQQSNLYEKALLNYNV